MTSAYQIATTFDRAGMSIAAVAARFAADARARQAAVDAEQYDRDMSAAERARRAVARQRAALQDAVDENASLKVQVARLQKELAASRAATASAETRVVAAQRETVRIKGLLRGAVGMRAA